MTDRERLIELFEAVEKDPAITCPHYKTDNTCDTCKYTINNYLCNHTERMIDYLLANGVFILPEDLRGTEDFSISAFIEAMQMYKEKDRYIKPPCKVEQEVFCLIQGFENPLKAKVKKIVMQESGVVISCSIYGYFGHSFMATDFGKTVFLTREEAGKAL